MSLALAPLSWRADMKEVAARFIGDTAIVLSRIELHAIVSGNVAANPLSVAETSQR